MALTVARARRPAPAVLPAEAEAPRPTLGERVYEGLYALIAGGEFPKGSRLPTELRLSQRFRVSRPVVREALARLREDGLIASRQGSGSYVRRRPDAAVLRFAPVSSLADMRRCFEFRAALEGEAAALAARHRDDATLARIGAALHALDAIVGRGELGADEDFAFHRAIAEAGGNRFFADTMASLQPHIRFAMMLARNLSLLKPRVRARTVQDEHVAVFEAIRAGNPELARRRMAAHIDNARQRVFEGQP